MASHRDGTRRAARARGGSLPSARGHLRSFVTVVLVTLGTVLLGVGLRAPDEPPAPSGEQWGTLQATAPGPSTARAPRVAPAPVRLDIGSVGIHTSLVDLGLNADGTLEVPSRPMLAGWYAGSAAPGARGSAVIAGHVDSRETGPAVFYRLGLVTPGDRVSIARADGSAAVFTVTAVRSYLHRAFPTREVYDDTGRATLRLVTCSDWNAETHSYDGNVVVFAELLRVTRA